MDATYCTDKAHAIRPKHLSTVCVFGTTLFWIFVVYHSTIVQTPNIFVCVNACVCGLSHRCCLQPDHPCFLQISCLFFGWLCFSFISLSVCVCVCVVCVNICGDWDKPHGYTQHGYTCTHTHAHTHTHICTHTYAHTHTHTHTHTNTNTHTQVVSKWKREREKEYTLQIIEPPTVTLIIHTNCQPNLGSGSPYIWQ